MGPTRRSARLADHVVLVGATAADSEGVPRSSAKALGSGADLCLALPKSTIQSRLRTTVCYQRGADLRRDGSPHGPEVSQNLSFQTVFSCYWGPAMCSSWCTKAPSSASCWCLVNATACTPRYSL